MDLFSLLHSYEPSPVLFGLGFFSVHWYGLLMAIGIVCGYLITRLIWLRRGKPLKELDELLFWLVLFGLIGARAFDVFFYEWWYFKNHLWEIFFVWQGGLAWHGGLLGGAIVLWWWSRQKGYSWLWLFDVFAPGLAVGQAVGRWGNYFNQELFGLPTNLPWGIPIAAVSRPANFVSYDYFHPAFLYESLALCLVGYALWYVSKKAWPEGKLFALYLIGTSLIRFLLEFIRTDEQNTFLNFKVGFWVSGLAFLLGIYVWLHVSNIRLKQSEIKQNKTTLLKQ